MLSMVHPGRWFGHAIEINDNEFVRRVNESRIGGWG